jgi:hypothetical protein
MILVVGLLNMAFIVLEHVLSMPDSFKFLSWRDVEFDQMYVYNAALFTHNIG